MRATARSSGRSCDRDREEGPRAGSRRTVETRSSMSGRRPMVRIGQLIPDAARELGLEAELRRSRAMATFDQLIAERVPAVVGACRVVRVDGATAVVEADAPIVAQELRLRAPELERAFAATPAGAGIREVRITVRRSGLPA
jgi:hypothetical protein